jgi:hypothetical protein
VPQQIQLIELYHRLKSAPASFASKVFIAVLLFTPGLQPGDPRAIELRNRFNGFSHRPITATSARFSTTLTANWR